MNRMQRDDIIRARQAIDRADALLIGASNGLSIAEGYHIFADNAMFRRQFGDLRERYGIRSVIEGCFFRYPDPGARAEFFDRLLRCWVEEYTPSEVMRDLRELVGGKEYFVLTTNADTHLELAGFDPARVFEIEGTFADAARNAEPADKSRDANDFIARFRDKRLVIVELGIGIRNQLIKQPLMQLAANAPRSTYITLNLAQELYIPDAIADRSIGLPGDIAETLRQLKEARPVNAPRHLADMLPEEARECFLRWRAFMEEQVVFSLPDSELHTRGHCERVLLHALHIACHSGHGTPDALHTLAHAAIFHDTRRHDDGLDTGHGERAATYYRHFCAEHPDIGYSDDARLLMACHDRDDAVGSETIRRARPAGADTTLALYRIFKDADALDRFRLGPQGLDVRYLRTEAARQQVDFARELIRLTEDDL